MTAADSLWQRVFDHLVASGHVLRSTAGGTPSDIAAVADRARGDDLVSRFVERFYYPQSFGAPEDGISEGEATSLVARIVSARSGTMAAAAELPFWVQDGQRYASLMEAVAHAADGDTIQVAEGRHAASVTINRNVRIVGRGDRASIVLEGRGGPALRIVRGSCELRHLTLAGSPPSDGEWTTALHIDEGSPLISGCAIEGRGSAAAATIYGDSTPVFDDCVITGDDKRIGMEFGYRARGEVLNCRIDGFGIGISLTGRAAPRIGKCAIGPKVGNAVHASAESLGVLLDCELRQSGATVPEGTDAYPLVFIKENANVRLERCNLHDCASSAIYVTGGSCELDGGVFSAVDNGIAVASAGQARLRAVTIAKTLRSGVRVTDQGKIELEDCVIDQAGADGLSLESQGTLTARRCKITGSAMAGLGIWKGTAHLEACELRSSGTEGVTFYDSPPEAAELTMLRSLITDSKGCGIDTQLGGRVRLEGTDILANGRHGILAGDMPLLVREGRIADNSMVGLLAMNGRVRLERTEVTRNKVGGLQVREGGVLLVTGCTIRESGGHGLYTWERSRTVLVDTTITASGDKCGVQLADSARAALFRVTIEKSGLHAILASDTTRLRAIEIDIRHPAHTGVCVVGSARAWLNGVTVHGAGGSGLEARQGGRIACVGGLISDAKASGVWARDRATRIVLAATKITGSGKAAVRADNEAEVEARRSTIPAGSLSVSRGARTIGLT